MNFFRFFFDRFKRLFILLRRSCLLSYLYTQFKIWFISYISSVNAYLEFYSFDCYWRKSHNNFWFPLSYNYYLFPNYSKVKCAEQKWYIFLKKQVLCLFVCLYVYTYTYYSFKIFRRFWLAPISRLILHNHLALTIFGRFEQYTIDSMVFLIGNEAARATDHPQASKRPFIHERTETNGVHGHSRTK